MTGKQRKNLARLRLVLSIIAVLLAGVMVLSGTMHFVVGAPVSEPEASFEPTETTQYTVPVTEPEISETEMAAETSESAEETSDGDTQPAGLAREEGKQLKPDNTESAGSQQGVDAPEIPTSPVVDKAPDLPNGAHNSGNFAGSTQDNAEETNITSETEETRAAVEIEDTEGTEKTEIAEEAKTTEAAEEAEKTKIPEAVEEAEAIGGKTEDSPTSEETLPSDAITDPVATEQSAATNNAAYSDAEKNPDPSAPQETAEQEDSEKTRIPWGLLFWCSAGLLALDLIAILVLSHRIHADKKHLATAGKKYPVGAGMAGHTPQTVTILKKPAGSASSIGIGTVHQMGSREYQQDSMGYVAVLEDKGMFAVVADGMGGLSNGEKVSRKIVMNMLGLAQRLNAGQINGILLKMVNQVNEDVNRMLGPDGLYKSGSTVVAILVYDSKFQWIAVGDSRIYLYRQGFANQLNRDHDQLQAWMPEVLEGKRSMEEILRNPDGRRLTSFIGMGQLKHIDGSVMPIALEAGDRLVLMSDGVYNVVNEDWLAAILKRYPDANQAASAIEHAVREANHPHQDNFTAIVLGF